MKVSLAMGLVLGVASAIETAAPVAAQTCEGDCNADSSVAIDEIILAIRLALGDAPIDECRATDSDADGAVTVNELVAAITRALHVQGPLQADRRASPFASRSPALSLVAKRSVARLVS